MAAPLRAVMMIPCVSTGRAFMVGELERGDAHGTWGVREPLWCPNEAHRALLSVLSVRGRLSPERESR